MKIIITEGQFNKLIESEVEDLWWKKYEPFWSKYDSERLGGSLNWSEIAEWEKDEKIQKWEKENRVHAAPLSDFTYGIYVIKDDSEVIDYLLKKFDD